MLQKLWFEKPTGWGNGNKELQPYRKQSEELKFGVWMD